MNIIGLIISFIVFSIIDDLLIRYEIRQNIDLFNDLHRKEVFYLLDKYKNK